MGFGALPSLRWHSCHYDKGPGPQRLYELIIQILKKKSCWSYVKNTVQIHTYFSTCHNSWALLLKSPETKFIAKCFFKRFGLWNISMVVGSSVGWIIHSELLVFTTNTRFSYINNYFLIWFDGSQAVHNFFFPVITLNPLRPSDICMCRLSNHH